MSVYTFTPLILLEIPVIPAHMAPKWNESVRLMRAERLPLNVWINDDMRLSSLADYAIVMMSAIARHCGAARLNAGQVAEETGIPLPTVQKLVSKLSAAGLLRSMRGAGGGFQLARPAAAVTLAEIIEAIEGPIAMTACIEEGRHECGLENKCRAQPHMLLVNEAVRGALQGITLTRLS